MAKIKPEIISKSIESKKDGTIMYDTLGCEHPGCTEVFRIAFSTLDDKGKDKEKPDKEIKKDHYDKIDKKNMPDSEHPEIWYCNKHAI